MRGEVQIRAVGESRIDDALSNAGVEVPLAEVIRVPRQRHRIEDLFEAGNGEAGLDHSEVRSWVGWHYHMTLSLVALWFLCLDRRRIGGKTPTVTVPQTRQIFARLLRQPAPTPEVVRRVLRRNEASRIDRWYKATETFLPRRTRFGYELMA